MGCLMDFFFEVIIEGTIELICYCYIKLMTLIVPDRAIPRRFRNKVKTVVTIGSVVVGFALVIGLILRVEGVVPLGIYMTNISLGIMGAQIGLGLLVWALTRKKK